MTKTPTLDALARKLGRPIRSHELFSDLPPVKLLGLFESCDVADRLAGLYEDEQTLTALAEAFPARCPSLRHSDHLTGCPWRDDPLLRDVAACICTREEEMRRSREASDVFVERFGRKS